MILRILLVAAALAAYVPAMADEISSSSTTIEHESAPIVTPAPVIEKTIVEPSPAIVMPQENNTTVIKKKNSHHLLNLGVVKVF